MRLNKLQIEAISKFFADLSKILFASAVVGFFIPGSSGYVNMSVFIFGSLFSLGLFILSIALLKSKEL